MPRRSTILMMATVCAALPGCASSQRDVTAQSAAAAPENVFDRDGCLVEGPGTYPERRWCKAPSWWPADPPGTVEWTYRRVCVAARIDPASLARKGDMNLDYQRSYTSALAASASIWLSIRHYSAFDPERPGQGRVVQTSAAGLTRCRDPRDIRILADISWKSREHYRIVVRLFQGDRTISRSVERRSYDEWPLAMGNISHGPGLAGGVSRELERLPAELLDQVEQS